MGVVSVVTVQSPCLKRSMILRPGLPKAAKTVSTLAVALMLIVVASAPSGRSVTSRSPCLGTGLLRIGPRLARLPWEDADHFVSELWSAQPRPADPVGVSSMPEMSIRASVGCRCRRGDVHR